ncbi:hybrid sensor histidine kinase/response regulator [Streptomyces sp. NBC_01476]|uniref:ATP-binding response regulator n=1 Tax=Streptomyces sp. NBC_01476 TaxID=2903881 RepID=UPI002E37EBF0|nr:hybrid sensor histidine kinase/response regulator [Streptomyces sp. NBC_01476]
MGDAADAARSAGPPAVLTIPLLGEREVFALRRDASAAFRLLGLPEAETVRLTTVLSEVGRDLLGAPGLTARLGVEAADPPRVTVRLDWSGDLEPSGDILRAADRLLDQCDWTPGTRSVLVLGQPLARTSLSPAELAARAREELVGLSGISMSEELRNQNHHLLAALEQARAHQEELQRLNTELEETNQGVMALYSELSKELEETNSGVVALYAELDEKSRQLALVSEAKTRFWANVSHELRSPANAVIGLTRLLLAAGADPLSAEQRQQIALIAASGSTLLALVEELLDVAKAESGRLEPELVDTDLRSLLHQLRGTLGGTARPGVRLVVPDDSRPQPLVTDEVMLTRILRNVLSNSLKYTETGEVRLDVGTEDRRGRPWYVFTITDTGVGIPADQQERVFEEFYQVRGPHQRAVGGTGLGLPYARKLTELLGGRLSLSSAPGEGTRVVVELPAETRIPLPGPAAGDSDEGDGVPPLGSLVVIDDDPAFLVSVRPVLAAVARGVTEVVDSSQAMAAVRAQRPDAVLLDLSMPPPDGYQLLEHLARDRALAGIPVVVLTAGDHEGIDRSRLTHARAVLGKTHLTPGRLAGVLHRQPATGRGQEGGTQP